MNLKELTADVGARMAVNSWFGTTDWITNTAGPPLGGVLISAVGATATMALDAVSYLGSAIGVWRIPGREPAPAERPAAGRGIGEVWRYVFAHRDLRGLFCNAMLFGGPVIMATPLLNVLILDDLRVPAWGMGLALGVPCLGGIAGSRLSPLLVRAFGQRRVLLVSGAARAPWMVLYPLAAHPVSGLVIVMAAGH